MERQKSHGFCRVDLSESVLVKSWFRAPHTNKQWVGTNISNLKSWVPIKGWICQAQEQDVLTRYHEKLPSAWPLLTEGWWLSWWNSVPMVSLFSNWASPRCTNLQHKDICQDRRETTSYLKPLKVNQDCWFLGEMQTEAMVANQQHIKGHKRPCIQFRPTNPEGSATWVVPWTWGCSRNISEIAPPLTEPTDISRDLTARHYLSKDSFALRLSYSSIYGAPAVFQALNWFLKLECAAKSQGS